MRNPTKAQREAEALRELASQKVYARDPLAWQLALPRDPEGKPVADTAANRNRRFPRMERETGSIKMSGGAGVVHGPYRPNVGKSTYAARHVAICTERKYDTRDNSTVFSAEQIEARKLSRKPAWARW